MHILNLSLLISDSVNITTNVGNMKEEESQVYNDGFLLYSSVGVCRVRARSGGILI